MNTKQNTWVLSIFLALVIWLGITPPSYATSNDAEILHVINRLSFGPRAGDIEVVKSQGIDAYIQSQLTPDSIAQPPFLTEQLASLETLQMSVAEIMKEYRQTRVAKKAQPGNPQPMAANPQNSPQTMQLRRKVLQEATQGRLVRAINSPRQLEEVMVDFWYNHFNVFSGKGLDRFLVGNYEQQAIRPYVFGKFRSLLASTSKHPAMLFYLDNWQNTAPNSPGAKGRYKGLNENYARELMELHTLGVNGGYNQQDVITLARIFTGWGFPGNRQRNTDESGFYFAANRHDSSDKVFLGQAIKGGGIEEGEKALDILAKHPATARHISYKLAQYFVADEPPKALVEQLAKRFQETDGDIKAVLTTLFSSSEFLEPKYYNIKLKTPYQYVISALRATDTQVDNFRSITGLLRQMGMAIYGCQTPDGYKNTEEAWLDPDAILRRISLTTALVNGRFAGKNSPVTAQQLSTTLGNNFSAKTRQVIASQPEEMKAALMLGSPEFMRK
ncbi:MAG: DUF1800 domain-containing protein [Coleofasciculaceae cyanobacterium]